MVRLLKKKVVIIWDEVQMQNRFCIKAVDRAMRRIRKNNRLFGGVPIVFGGDFLMTLPEVDQAASVGLEWDKVGEPPAHASLEESYIWDKLDEHLLETNKRLIADEKNRRFISWWNDNLLLRNVGSSASLPSDVNISDNLESFVKKVYPEDILNGRTEHDAFADRCILSTIEESAAAINLTALELLQIENQHRFSFRAFDVPEDETQPETLSNALDCSGIPPARLDLKLGSPLILLANIDPANGLCAGSRLKFLRCKPNALEAIITTGRFAGQKCFIPRLKLYSRRNERWWSNTAPTSGKPQFLPCRIARFQFPVRLCFAMTVAQSRGQSFSVIGFDSRVAPTRSELYIAFFRVKDVRNLHLLKGVL